MFLCEMDYRLKKNTVALIHSQREMSVFDLGTETFQGFFYALTHQQASQQTESNKLAHK